MLLVPETAIFCQQLCEIVLQLHMFSCWPKCQVRMRRWVYRTLENVSVFVEWSSCRRWQIRHRTIACQTPGLLAEHFYSTKWKRYHCCSFQPNFCIEQYVGNGVWKLTATLADIQYVICQGFCEISCFLAYWRKVRIAVSAGISLILNKIRSKLNSKPLFESIVQNKVLHRSEIWPLTKSVRDKIWTAELDFIRRMLQRIRKN